MIELDMYKAQSYRLKKFQCCGGSKFMKSKHFTGNKNMEKQCFSNIHVYCKSKREKELQHVAQDNMALYKLVQIEIFD